MDLSNPEMKAFCAMPEEWQEALRASGDVEFLVSHTGEWETKPFFSGPFRPGYIYRLRPAPVREPAYPWEHLADWIKWCARDEDGMVWGSSCVMYPEKDQWSTEEAGCVSRLDDAWKFDKGTVHWTKSLRQRPETGAVT